MDKGNGKTSHSATFMSHRCVIVFAFWIIFIIPYHKLFKKNKFGNEKETYKELYLTCCSLRIRNVDPREK